MSNNEPAHKLTVKILGELRTIQAYDIQEFQLRRAELIDGLAEDLELIHLAHAVTTAAPLVNTVAAPVAMQPVEVTQSAVTVPAPSWGQPSAPPVFAPQTSAPAAFVPAAPMCDHGPRMPMNKVGKNGPYKAWFCGTPQGTPNQCSPIFLNRGTAEYANFPA